MITIFSFTLLNSRLHELIFLIPFTFTWIRLGWSVFLADHFDILLLYYNKIVSHESIFGAAAGEGLNWVLEYSFWTNRVLLSLPLFCIYFYKNWKIKNTFPKVFSKIPKKIIKLQPRLDRKEEHCKPNKPNNIAKTWN